MKIRKSENNSYLAMFKTYDDIDIFCSFCDTRLLKDTLRHTLECLLDDVDELELCIDIEGSRCCLE